MSSILFSCQQQENSSKTITQENPIHNDTLPKVEEFEGLYFPSKQGSSGMLNVCFGENHSLAYPVEDETN